MDAINDYYRIFKINLRSNLFFLEHQKSTKKWRMTDDKTENPRQDSPRFVLVNYILSYKWVQ